MKIKLFFIFFLPLIFNYSIAHAEVSTSFWQTEKSQHFVVYYQEVPAGFVSELINRAEDYYSKIVDNLGYRRMDFWSWDKRAKIYLYKNADDFHKETQRSQWAGAVVSVNDRTIRAFLGQQDFFDSILPHEMTHIIFREFVGKNIPLPLWIDEGIACSQEESNLRNRKQIAKNLIAKSEYIKMDKFCEITNLDNVTPYIFYAQAATVMDFIIKEQGRDGFFDYSRRLRDGGDWKNALFSVYRFSNFEEMEQKWKESVIKG